VGFHRNPVSHFEFIHRVPKRGHDPGILVTRDEGTVRRLAWERLGHESHVCAAAGAHFHLEKNFHGAGFRDWNLLDDQLVRAFE
jgi:hypothetical protein